MFRDQGFKVKGSGLGVRDLGLRNQGSGSATPSAASPFTVLFAAAVPPLSLEAACVYVCVRVCWIGWRCPWCHA